MENSSHENDSDREMTILKFMEVTECETYEEAKFFVAMHEYNLKVDLFFIIKDALAAYMMNKGQSGHATLSTDSGNLSAQRKNSVESTKLPSNNEGFTLSPEEAAILEKRLLSNTFSSERSQNMNNLIKNREKPENKSMCSKLFGSCKNSFRCFHSIKKQLKRKINSMKKDSDKIFYFQELYQSELEEAGFEPENGLIEGFELSQVEENQKLKTTQKEDIKPIFVLICPNRKSPLIENILQNLELMTFIRQNFEPLFITLSELKELKLERKHAIRNIKKCPTALVYVKNFYDLEDVLVAFEGEEIKNINEEKLKMGLEHVPDLMKKWNYLLSLEKQLREHSVTSLSQVVHENDYDDISSYDHESITYNPTYQATPEHPETKRSLIQEQTKIYEQLVAEEVKRKKSLELEKQKFEEQKELREIRKMSIPEEPSLELFEQSIEFRFRCPLNGEYILRRFLKDEKVDILYQFVDTNDKIEFENEPERSFDLFTSFPPMSLSEKKEFLLKDVFDQEKENILIREV